MGAKVRVDYAISSISALHAEATVAAGAPGQAFDDVLERYSYGELQVIADFLTADIDRLRAD